MTQIPDYIERRIRQPIPADLCVIPGTTPVVAFGDARKAKVATLGYNPSHHEFLDRHGRELTSSNRRLATHRSLGFKDLEVAPQATIAQVLDDCNTYFQRKPYCRWFDQLEPIIRACRASYYDGTACHLDLVQWATKPAWGELNPMVKCRLLLADASFLKEQLTNENIELILVNGRDATEIFQGAFCKSLENRCPIEMSGKRINISVGLVLDRIRVIAWSAYVQRGVSQARKDALANKVAQLTQEIQC